MYRSLASKFGILALAFASVSPSSHAASSDAALLAETRAAAQLGYATTRTAANGAASPSAIAMADDLLTRATLAGADRISALGIKLEALDDLGDSAAWNSAFANLPESIPGLTSADYTQRKNLWRISHLCAIADWPAAQEAMLSFVVPPSGGPGSSQLRADYELARLDLAINKSPESIQPYLDFAQFLLAYESVITDPAERDPYYGRDGIRQIDPLNPGLETFRAELINAPAGSVAWRRLWEFDRRLMLALNMATPRTLKGRDQASSDARVGRALPAIAPATTGLTALRDHTIHLWDSYMAQYPNPIATEFPKAPTTIAGVDEKLWKANHTAWRMLNFQTTVGLYPKEYAQYLGAQMEAVAPMLGISLREALMRVFARPAPGANPLAVALGPLGRGNTARTPTPLPPDIEASVKASGLHPDIMAKTGLGVLDPAAPETAQIVADVLASLSAPAQTYDRVIEINAILAKANAALPDTAPTAAGGASPQAVAAAAIANANQKQLDPAIRNNIENTIRAATKAAAETLDAYEMRRDSTQVSVRRRLMPLLIEAQGHLNGDAAKSQAIADQNKPVRANPQLANLLGPGNLSFVVPPSGGTGSAGSAGVPPALGSPAITPPQVIGSGAFRTAIEKLTGASDRAQYEARTAAMTDAELGAAVRALPPTFVNASTSTRAYYLLAEAIARGAARMNLDPTQHRDIRRRRAEMLLADPDFLAEAKTLLAAVAPELTNAELAKSVRALPPLFATAGQQAEGKIYLDEAHKRGPASIGLNPDETREAETHRARLMLVDPATEAEGIAILQADAQTITNAQLLKEITPPAPRTPRPVSAAVPPAPGSPSPTDTSRNAGGSPAPGSTTASAPRPLPNPANLIPTDRPRVLAELILHDEALKRGYNNLGLTAEQGLEAQRRRARILLNDPARAEEGAIALAGILQVLTPEQLKESILALPTVITGTNAVKASLQLLDEAQTRGFESVGFTPKEARSLNLRRGRIMLGDKFQFESGRLLIAQTADSLTNDELGQQVMTLPDSFTNRQSLVAGKEILNEASSRGFDKIGLTSKFGRIKEFQRAELLLGVEETFNEAMAYLDQFASVSGQENSDLKSRAKIITETLRRENLSIEHYKWGIDWATRILALEGNNMIEMMYLLSNLGPPLFELYQTDELKSYYSQLTPPTRNIELLVLGESIADARGRTRDNRFAQAAKIFARILEETENQPNNIARQMAGSWWTWAQINDAQLVGNPNRETQLQSVLEFVLRELPRIESERASIEIASRGATAAHHLGRVDDLVRLREVISSIGSRLSKSSN